MSPLSGTILIKDASYIMEVDSSRKMVDHMDYLQAFVLLLQKTTINDEKT